MRNKTNPKRHSEDKAARRVALLPDTHVELLTRAKGLVLAYNEAIIQGDEDAQHEAYEQYRAVISELNGGSFFACADGPQAPESVVAAYCAAKAGTVPLWGQIGEFLIEVNGMRALVRVMGTLSSGTSHIAFHVVDVELPFISETGYRSHFVCVPHGIPVDELVRYEFVNLLSQGGRQLVRLGSRDMCRQVIEERPGLSLTMADSAPAAYADGHGQMCLVM